jgi:hypothetical protein
VHSSNEARTYYRFYDPEKWKIVFTRTVIFYEEGQGIELVQNQDEKEEIEHEIIIDEGSTNL